MKKMSKLALRFHGAVAALALSATAANVNTICVRGGIFVKNEGIKNAT